VDVGLHNKRLGSFTLQSLQIQYFIVLRRTLRDFCYGFGTNLTRVNTRVSLFYKKRDFEEIYKEPAKRTSSKNLFEEWSRLQKLMKHTLAYYTLLHFISLYCPQILCIFVCVLSVLHFITS